MASATTLRRKILVAGLGKYAPKDANSVARFGADLGVLQAQIESSVARAIEDGFDITQINVNPAESARAEVIKDLETRLTTQTWDGFIIGYGVRGPTTMTSFFEALVNASRISAPQTKLGFSNGPDKIDEAALRMFPADQKQG